MHVAHDLAPFFFFFQSLTLCIREFNIKWWLYFASGILFCQCNGTVLVRIYQIENEAIYKMPEPDELGTILIGAFLEKSPEQLDHFPTANQNPYHF